MTIDKLPEAYDVTDDAHPANFIYRDSIALKHDAVQTLMRRDRRRSWTMRFILVYASVVTVGFAYVAGNEKVYVYEIARDHAGRKELVLLDNVYTPERGSAAWNIMWWVIHARRVTTDPVANDEFKAAALARVAGAMEVALKLALEEWKMPMGWTRSVDMRTFGFTQVSESDGAATYSIEWIEKSYYRFALKSEDRMLATVTVRTSGLDSAARRKGNVDGMWIDGFDVQKAPPLRPPQSVAFGATSREIAR